TTNHPGARARVFSCPRPTALQFLQPFFRCHCKNGRLGVRCPRRPAFAPSAGPFEAPMTEILTPKLVSVLAEGYAPARLKADMLSGLTVAIVALPLSMAIAIASGVTPDRGLYTAIVGGFL